MQIRLADVADVVAYFVVLELFTHVFPQVISETFLLAVLTAILLKVVLELIVRVKKKLLARVRAADSPAARTVNAATLVLMLPASKFLVLELVALVFGESVQLGGFFQVTALIIVLMLVRGAVRRLLLPPVSDVA